MDSDNDTRASQDEVTQLSSPNFDSAATDRAHPVVPLGNVSERTSSPRSGFGLFPAIGRVRPAVLAVVAVLVAAAIMGAATAIYMRPQSIAPTPTQVSDPIAPGPSLATAEASSRKDTTPVAPAKRRDNPDLDTPRIPSRRADYPTPKEEVIGTIRELLRERMRSRGKHQGKRKHGKDAAVDDDN